MFDYFSFALLSFCDNTLETVVLRQLEALCYIFSATSGEKIGEDNVIIS